jgi:Fur family ferric uptake transcriptional regulator
MLLRFAWVVYMLSRLEQLCLEKGLKMTDQRQVISRVLSAAIDHPGVEQVYRRDADIDEDQYRHRPPA